MNLAEGIRIALQSLWANKLRSVLTLLGVVIAISSVIAVVTFVNGINGYVAEKVFNLGADVFIASKKSVITNADDFIEMQRRKNLTVDDYQAVREYCKHCLVVGASQAGKRGTVKFESHSSADSAIRGWTPSMSRIYDLELIAGRSITEADQKSGSPVVVIGYDIYDNLLAGRDPINREIRVEGKYYRVIGVGKKEGKVLGQSRDNWVMLPLNAWMKQFGANDWRNSLSIWVKATGVGTQMTTAMDEVRVILRARRHDAPTANDSFDLNTNQTFLSLWSNLSSTFFAVTVAIASISLIIGGIVIMNIMLMAVTERTREIGIRKALGARKRDVLSQFLIESGTMALVGGIIGIIGGVAIAKTITAIIGMPSKVEVWSVLAGLAVAASVGIFFGVYPARKAAELDPIVALRAEL